VSTEPDPSLFVWDDFERDAEEASGTRRPGCTAGRLIASLPGEGQDVVNEALEREELTTPAILQAIKKRVDTDVSTYTLRRHRRGDCTCKG
jgi:hypothetical protein